jgi:hypothetical protein
MSAYEADAQNDEASCEDGGAEISEVDHGVGPIDPYYRRA